MSKEDPKRPRYTYLFNWWQHLARRWEPVAFVLLALLAMVFWPLPQWMVRHEYWVWRDHPEQYAKLVDDYRKTLVQIIGGAFLLYTLYLTQRRTKATERTLEATLDSLKITKETQVTDRFTKAITQLGATDSQGKKQLEIRFGGIYSLERIARDSPDDHWPIMEILTAYVRENSPWIGPDDVKASDKADSIRVPPLSKDIQAVMTVIGRRNWEHDKDALDLHLTDLRGVHLPKANLENAQFFGANLEVANFFDSRLSGAEFEGAHMAGATLYKAHMEGAILNYAHLEGAVLSEANLKGVRLREAHLEGANLVRTTLQEADLFGAYLEGATLSEANLEGADLVETHLEGAALSNALISQKQIDDAFGNQTTKLPRELIHPISWQ